MSLTHISKIIPTVMACLTFGCPHDAASDSDFCEECQEDIDAHFSPRFSRTEED